MKKLLACGFILGLGFFLLDFSPVTGQDRKEATKPAPGAKQKGPEGTGKDQTPPDPELADISFTATVRAREVRFKTVPRVAKVEFSGTPQRKAGSKSDRKDLPREVKPGVTYRNVEVHYTFGFLLRDLDRIVQDAIQQQSEKKARDRKESPAPKRPRKEGRQ